MESDCLSDKTIHCDFEFDEETWREYVRLAFRAHEREDGRRLAVAGLLASLPCGAIFAISAGALCSGGKDVSWVFVVLFGFLAARGIVAVVYGTCLWLGLRKPDWNSPAWRARSEVQFSRLREHQLDTPLSPPRKPGWDTYSDYWVVDTAYIPWLFEFSRWYPAMTTCSKWDYLWGYGGRQIKRDLPEPTDTPLSPVSFSCGFEANRILKGSSGVVFADDYAEIHDVLEWRRCPHVAILRACEVLPGPPGYSIFRELVVRKDALSAEEWAEVRRRVAEGRKRWSLRQILTS